MRFAVVGAGSIGAIHAHVIAQLSPAASVAVVVGRDEGRTAAAAALCDAEPSISLAQTLARGDIDAVTICTPTGSHADIASRALYASKHVVVEKPLDVSLHAARRVIEAQRRTGGTLTVISQHRFDPASLTVQEAIRHGRLGRLTSGVVTVPWWRPQSYYDGGAWRGTQALDGGGALLNQAIHAIDLMVWFLGTPLEVFAWTGQLAHQRIEVEDTAVATLRFAGDALGVIHAATSAYPGLGTRLQVHGDQGSAIIEADQLTCLHTSDHPESATPDRSPKTPTATSPTVTDSLRAQYQDFLSAVQDGREPLVTARAAARSLSVVEASYRSAATGLPTAVAEPDTPPAAAAHVSVQA